MCDWVVGILSASLACKGCVQHPFLYVVRTNGACRGHRVGQLAETRSIPMFPTLGVSARTQTGCFGWMFLWRKGAPTRA